MGSENNMVAVQVTQVDRDAAARVHERSCYEHVRIQGVQCRNGYADSDPLVLDFARHRLVSTQPDAQQGEGLDWREIARLAGEHGVRYRTNSALTKFLAAVRSLPATPSSPALDAATIERCARALADRYIERSMSRYPGPAHYRSLDDMPKSYSDDFYADARAVLTALALPNAEKRHG